MNRTNPGLLRSCAAAVALALSASVTSAQTFNDVPVAVVPTDAGGTLTLRMDVYKPTGVTEPTPVLVWIHGAVGRMARTTTGFPPPHSRCWQGGFRWRRSITG